MQILKLFTYAGLLNPEELSMINKVFKKAKSRQQSSVTREDVKRDIHKRSKVPINIGGLASSQAVMEHRTRKSGAGLVSNDKGVIYVSAKFANLIY